MVRRFWGVKGSGITELGRVCTGELERRSKREATWSKERPDMREGRWAASFARVRLLLRAAIVHALRLLDWRLFWNQLVTALYGLYLC